MKQAKEIAIPDGIEKGFQLIARELLGTGYVDEYYDTTIVPELRWAYQRGYEDGLKKR